MTTAVIRPPLRGPQLRGNHCSSDLHTVVDCDGNVITTCPPDQGCSGTSCVPACQSANDNKSNIGCDYFVVDPDVILDGAGACFAAFVANTWGTTVTLSVEWNGQTLDPSKFAYVPNGTGTTLKYTPLATGKLAPNQVAILFLNRHPGIPSFLQLDCPPGITPAITAVDTATHGTGSGTHSTPELRRSRVDIFPHAVWQRDDERDTPSHVVVDTNYVAVDAYGGSARAASQITGQKTARR